MNDHDETRPLSLSEALAESKPKPPLDAILPDSEFPEQPHAHTYPPPSDPVQVAALEYVRAQEALSGLLAEHAVAEQTLADIAAAVIAGRRRVHEARSLVTDLIRPEEGGE